MKNELILLLIILVISAGSVHVCYGTDEAGTCSQDGCQDEGKNYWTEDDEQCNKVNFGGDSFVCACTSEYCDYPGIIAPPEDTSKFIVIASSRDSHRFKVTSHDFKEKSKDKRLTITLNPTITHQSMMGYGGAFTDAAGINLYSLSSEVQGALIKSYFSKGGLDYNLGRVPIGGTDFSTHPYAYNEVKGDVELKHFALSEEDLKYKMPFIKSATKMNPDLRLVASSWSPPAWMKTNNKIFGSGQVKKELRQVFTNYLVKFFEEYRKSGIEMFALTSQNEPLSGLTEEWTFNNCAWPPEVMRDWIGESLGPSLQDAGYGNLKLIINDQVITRTLNYTTKILENDRTSKYVDGISVHWYTDSPEDMDTLTKISALFPSMFLLYTEACTGFDSPADERVKLGDWTRAEQYAESLIRTANHQVQGWIDWNLVLDMKGGPNWAGNFVDAPILVDTEKDTFYKQPIFYALGHFSKFVTEGTKVVFHTTTGEDQGLNVIAFKTPSNSGIVIILNKNENDVPVSIVPTSSRDRHMQLNVPGRSIHTLLFTYE